MKAKSRREDDSTFVVTHTTHLESEWQEISLLQLHIDCDVRAVGRGGSLQSIHPTFIFILDTFTLTSSL